MLINELADLLVLLKSAKRTKKVVKYFLLFRFIAVMSVFLILYVRMLI